MFHTEILVVLSEATRRSSHHPKLHPDDNLISTMGSVGHVACALGSPRSCLLSLTLSMIGCRVADGDEEIREQRLSRGGVYLCVAEAEGPWSHPWSLQTLETLKLDTWFGRPWFGPLDYSNFMKQKLKKTSSDLRKHTRQVLGQKWRDAVRERLKTQSLALVIRKVRNV